MNFKQLVKFNTQQVLNKVPNKVSQPVGRQLLVLQKNSPTILFGAGIVGVVTGTVLACRATLKLDEVLDEINPKLEDVRNLQHDNYTEKDRAHDRAVLYVSGGVRVAQMYLPAAFFMAAGIGCLAGSHGILTKRNAGLMTAYATLDQSFDAYRERVRTVVGEEKEENIYRPVEEHEVKDPETGKEVKAKVRKGGGKYAKCFDESNINWNKEYPYNQTFVQAQQNFANDLLLSRGHIFLNEVYTMLGFPHTPEGALVGWVLEGGSGKVDVGVFSGNEYEAMRFVQGYTPSVWLDFNVDGIIYDKI